MTTLFDVEKDPVDDGCPEYALRFEEVRSILDLVDDMNDALEMYDADEEDEGVGLSSLIFRKGDHFFQVRAIDGSWAIDGGSCEIVINGSE